MSGEDLNENIMIKNLLKTLKKKVNLNKNILGFTVAQIQELNPSYFYSLWKKSFNKVPYKKNKNYKKFVDKEKIIPMETM